MEIGDVINLIHFIPNNIFTKTGNKIYKLNVAYPGEKFLISNRKDKYKNFYYPKYLIIPNDKLCLWYSWPAGRNQNNPVNSGFRIKYCIVPKTIKLDKETMQALGLLQAEMTKRPIRASNIVFTNSEFQLINNVLKFFENTFDFDRNFWSWGITFNYKLRRNENIYQRVMRENLALEHWLNKTNISLKNKRNKYIHYTGNYKYFNMRPQTPIHGSLVLSHSNIILYQLILNILDIILLNEDTLSVDQKVYYIQGLVAGEGSVKLSVYESVQSISIGCCDPIESQKYMELLKSLNIESSMEKIGTIRICGLNNFLKFYNLELLNLHPNKKHRFNLGLVHFKQIPDNLKPEFYSVKKEVISYGA